MPPRRSAVVTLVAMALAIAACGPAGGGGESPEGTASIPGRTPGQGDTERIQRRNGYRERTGRQGHVPRHQRGPNDIHEFVVILADDLAPDALPTP